MLHPPYANNPGYDRRETSSKQCAAEPKLRKIVLGIVKEEGAGR